MPAPPEIREADRGIGEPEIILQMKSKAQCRADRADGVAREIEKDLARKCHHTRPRIERDQRTAITEDRVRRPGEKCVGEHDFLEKAQGHQEQSPEETALLRLGRRLELRQEITRTHDRTGDELREKRDREHEIAQRARRLQDPAINVEGVGERMKGVERDADREKEIKMRRLVGDPAPRQDPLEILEQKIPVLEKPEHAQVDRDADHEPNLAGFRLSLFAHDPAEVEIHRGRAEEEGGERRIPRAVENITRDHEQVFACRPGAHHPIRAHHHCEEDDESKRVK